MNKYQVVFQPSGRRGLVDEGKTVKEASLGLGVALESICGERSTCGKCKVRVEEGRFERLGIESQQDHLSPMEERELEYFRRHPGLNGYRLACVARIQGDLVIYVPEESRLGQQVVRKAGRRRAITLRPAIRKYYVELAPPTLEDASADWERLAAELADRFGLKGLNVDYLTLVTIPGVLRQGGWKVTATVWQGREVIRVEPGFDDRAYGLAIDVGTTTVVAFLCDLSDGHTLVTESSVNPQIGHGEDVISRISYAMSHPNGLADLHGEIIQTLNNLAQRSAAAAGIDTKRIVDACIVGNTCMHHILLKIDPTPLGQSPFVPGRQGPIDIKARDLGLGICLSANVHFLPVEAGFVGADNVAVLIAEAPYNQDDITLIIDIGTNGELVLGNRDRMLSASCATGPVFEGAHIGWGMRAAEGAIEKVRIDMRTLETRFKVIGNSLWSNGHRHMEAKGICGSGIIDSVAEMFRAGIIAKSGRFNRELVSPRLRQGADGKWEFIVAWAQETAVGRDISISQDDVRAVQLGKAALYAAAKLMLRRMGQAQAEKVVLAGAFGSFLDKERAMAIGMFPDRDPSKVIAVGNAAGDGARIALLDVEKRLEADRIARWTEYIELTLEPDFQETLIAAMDIPHAVDLFPHTEKYLGGDK